MKRAFTLIEMMIVVAILAILMTITFRLTGSGDNDKKRVNTIVTMQKIENCLSGYYAAFGSYPPVALQGSRDIYCQVQNGGQTGQQQQGKLKDISAQVQAACRSQPFGCEYPPSPNEKVEIEKWAFNDSDSMKARVSGGKYKHYGQDQYQYAFAFQGNLTEPNPEEDFTDAFPRKGSKNLRTWQQVQLFRFGVMSYLLPRYLFMLRGDSEWISKGDVCLQWADANEMPSDPLEGVSFSDLQQAGGPGEEGDSGWELMQEWAGGHEEGSSSQTESSEEKFNRMRVANIPSQAVCARWMPNLEGLCMTTISETFFGINITGSSWLRKDNGFTTDQGDPYAVLPPDVMPIHTAPNGTPYCLGWMTIYDGWNQEFFYYSLPPYQSYTLWSSGPNKKTFPPWIPLDELDDDDDIKTAAEWKADDIAHMSN